MNETVQLTCCKQEASSRWKLDIARHLAFHVSITYKESHHQVIQCNSVSTRQNVTQHWIVWILSDLPVSPCLEIPDGPLGVLASVLAGTKPLEKVAKLIAGSHALKAISWSERFLDIGVAGLCL